MSGDATEETALERHALQWLKQKHIGNANGINGKRLAERLECTPRQERTAISALRERGQPICGRPETGYFWPANKEELNSTLAFLTSRAMHTLTVKTRMQAGYEHWASTPQAQLLSREQTA